MENHEPVIVIDQKESTKKRGTLAIILAIAFVAILGIGGTFAYLTWTTNQTPNRITTDPTVTADVVEPAWTNAIDATGTYKASDGTAVPKAADNMLPGSVVAKNPFVVNTSNNGSDEFCALKVQFQKWTAKAEGGTDGEYVNMTATEVATLLKSYAFLQSEGDATSTAGFTTLGTNWTQITDKNYFDGTAAGTAGTANASGAMYFYNSATVKAETEAVAKAEANTGDNATTWNIGSDYRTTPLFTHIRFIDTATQTNINELNKVLKGSAKPADPGWRIVISGAAIQATTGKNASDFVDTTGTENWKTLLDQLKDTTDADSTAKPSAATGVRANSPLSTKIPEVSQVN